MNKAQILHKWEDLRDDLSKIEKCIDRELWYEHQPVGLKSTEVLDSLGKASNIMSRIIDQLKMEMQGKKLLGES